MAKRNASAKWNGGVKDGKGSMKLGSGAFEGAFSFNTRMGDEPGTNPEELIGAALAGCFTMALSAALESAGHTAVEVNTDAVVNFGKDDAGFAITSIDLTTKASVADISDDEFQQIAAKTKETCPVSKALKAVDITLDASLA